MGANAKRREARERRFRQEVAHGLTARPSAKDDRDTADEPSMKKGRNCATIDEPEDLAAEQTDDSILLAARDGTDQDKGATDRKAQRFIVFIGLLNSNLRRS